MSNLKTGVIALLYVLLAANSVHAQNFNRPVPPLIAPYEFRKYDSACYGYFLTAPVKVKPTRVSDGSIVQPEMILDPNGYVVWYEAKPPVVVNSDFNYFPQAGVFVYCAVVDTSRYVRYLLDSTFNIIDSVDNLNGVKPDAHDFAILPNGNYLVAGRLDSIADLSRDTFNGKPGGAHTRLMGFVLQEIDKQHRLVWQWNSNDFVNPAYQVRSYGYKPQLFDYCHGNAFELCSDGNYLISFRNLDAVYKIDRTTGKILWQLGGVHSDFKFINDEGFSGQHDVRELPNGNITLYDNANSSAAHQSRGVEYRLDTVNHTATKVWSSAVKPGLYASGMGNLQTLAGGNRLISYGQVYKPNPGIDVMNDKNELLAQFFFADSFMSYRSFLYDLPFQFPRPKVSVSKTKYGVVLKAPAGYKNY
ncbi:MAG TPA: aryl-sulfate sulfotransferase, partial [Chitinophagales bacterium]|nr:aryl-sulfate sulfotransferase [Chitinophagales bacterium]